MPFVSVRSSQHIADDKMERLQQGIGQIISVIPGKNSENCMIHITGDCKIFMGGKPSNAVFAEVRMFGKAPKDKKKEFAAEFNKVITAELGEVDKLFLNFQEYFEWSIGSNYIDF